jgi:hypothetical protein
MEIKIDGRVIMYQLQFGFQSSLDVIAYEGKP